MFINFILQSIIKVCDVCFRAVALIAAKLDGVPSEKQVFQNPYEISRKGAVKVGELKLFVKL